MRPGSLMLYLAYFCNTPFPLLTTFWCGTGRFFFSFFFFFFILVNNSFLIHWKGCFECWLWTKTLSWNTIKHLVLENNISYPRSRFMAGRCTVWRLHTSPHSQFLQERVRQFVRPSVSVQCGHLFKNILTVHFIRRVLHCACSMKHFPLEFKFLQIQWNAILYIAVSLNSRDDVYSFLFFFFLVAVWNVQEHLPRENAPDYNLM